ncbi:hypothetical protein ABZ282_30625, partial [Amycolatopsis tolypomycina]
LISSEKMTLVMPCRIDADRAKSASRIDQVEQAIVETVRGGATLAEARARHGYHSLQTPKDGR